MFTVRTDRWDNLKYRILSTDYIYAFAVIITRNTDFSEKHLTQH